MINPFEVIDARLSNIESLLTELNKTTAQQTVKKEPEPGHVAPPYVSKKEAARLLMCSQSTIDNMARDGRLTRFYVGKSVKFQREQVLSLARQHATTKQKRHG